MMSKAIPRFTPAVILLSCFFLLTAGSCKEKSQKEVVKRTETLVYHVHGLTIPDKEKLEKCRELKVRIKSESCIIDSKLAKQNRYIDSVVKAEYGVSVLEVLSR